MLRFVFALATVIGGAAPLAAQAADSSARWTATGELAFTDVSGNQSLSLLATGLEFGRIDPDASEMKLKLQARYGRSDGSVSVENYSAEFAGQLRPGVGVTPSLTTSVLRDRFRNLDLRLTLAAGVQIRLLRDSDNQLRFGLALLQDYEVRDLPADSPEPRELSRTRLDAGMTASFPLRPGVTLEHQTGFQPAANRLPDYLLTSRTSLRVLLTRTLAFQTAYTYLRDNTPAPGVHSKDDRTLTTGLLLNFH